MPHATGVWQPQDVSKNSFSLPFLGQYCLLPRPEQHAVSLEEQNNDDTSIN